MSPAATPAQIVYVLGTSRSGTSAVRSTIASTRYRGPGEGHFIGLIHALQTACATYYERHAKAVAAPGTLLSKVPPEQTREAIYEFGRRAYEDRFPGGFIVDKTPTPEPILALGVIERMWPAVRFVFCKRRGIDTVLSKLRKWPQRPMESHCREWANVMRLWDSAKAEIKSPWVEIEFHDLDNDPAGTGERLGAFLSLGPDEIAKMQSYISTNRPQSTGHGAGDYVTLDGSDWTDEQKHAFVDLCGPMMDTYGYGLDGYWKRSGG